MAYAVHAGTVKGNVGYDPYLYYSQLYNQQKKTTPSNKLTVQEKRLSSDIPAPTSPTPKPTTPSAPIDPYTQYATLYQMSQPQKSNIPTPTPTPKPTVTPTPTPKPTVTPKTAAPYTPPPAQPPTTVSQTAPRPRMRPDPSTPEYVANVAQSVYREFNNLISQASAEGQALIAQQFSFFMDNLKATEQQIIKMFQDQMGTVDPATQMALAQIRESAEMARNAMNEEMNRRGLLQSGIWVETATRLQKNQLTAEQTLLAQRITDLQNQLNAALMNFAQQRLSAIQQFGAQQVDLALRTGDQRVNAMQAAYGIGQGQAQMAEGARQFEERMAQDVTQWQQQYELQKEMFDWEKQFKQTQFDWEKQFKQAQFDWEKQQASTRASADQARGSYIATIQQNALNQLDALIKQLNVPQQYRQTLINEARARGIVVPTTKEEALEYVVQDFMRQAYSLGLTQDEIRDTINLLRMFAQGK